MAGSNRADSRRQSSKIAFCGMMVALSVALMLTGGLIPIATYCAPLMCGVLLLPIFLEYGKKTALTAYAATSLIVLILGIDKEAAFFYIFLGYYPVIKWNLDKLKNKPLRILVKLIIFNTAVFAMYAVLGWILHMDAVVAEFTEMGIWLLAGFVVLLNICLLMYDKLLIALTIVYVKKLRPKLHFLLK